jgi:hypothetical protein
VAQSRKTGLWSREKPFGDSCKPMSIALEIA